MSKLSTWEAFNSGGGCMLYLKELPTLGGQPALIILNDEYATICEYVPVPESFIGMDAESMTKAVGAVAQGFLTKAQYESEDALTVDWVHGVLVGARTIILTEWGGGSPDNIQNVALSYHFSEELAQDIVDAQKEIIGQDWHEDDAEFFRQGKEAGLF